MTIQVFTKSATFTDKELLSLALICKLLNNHAEEIPESTGKRSSVVLYASELEVVKKFSKLW